MVKKAKYGFELSGLNIMKIHVKYGIDISIENCVIEDDPESTTKLVDLHNKGATPEIVSFVTNEREAGEMWRVVVQRVSVSRAVRRF